MAGTETIQVSSVFKAPPEKIWPLLTHMDTLRYIASPYAAFVPAGKPSGETWRAGETYRFRLRVFGIIPLGVHTIRVQIFDHGKLRVQTAENNRFVPTWNHCITLEPEGISQTRYTDEVEIGAGRFTGLVRLWSAAFYRHRQKRWARLLAPNRNKPAG
ncbi:MAG: hypothetical protein LBR98_02485 [Syntrophomonadaceae bacterium]|nr:hypothetical protein [Syntrophomonadaceae bacterium]